MKHRSNFSTNALLSGFGAIIIFVLITAGVCEALRKRLLA